MLSPRLEGAFTFLASLKKDWDGEGSPAPDNKSLGTAYAFLIALDHSRIPAVSIVPDVMGGVGVFLHDRKGGSSTPKTRMAWFTFENDEGGDWSSWPISSAFYKPKTMNLPCQINMAHNSRELRKIGNEAIAYVLGESS
jgi:hypothetical protein